MMQMQMKMKHGQQRAQGGPMVPVVVVQPMVGRERGNRLLVRGAREVPDPRQGIAWWKKWLLSAVSARRSEGCPRARAVQPALQSQLRLVTVLLLLQDQRVMTYIATHRPPLSECLPSVLHKHRRQAIVDTGLGSRACYLRFRKIKAGKRRRVRIFALDKPNIRVLSSCTCGRKIQLACVQPSMGMDLTNKSEVFIRNALAFDLALPSQGCS